MVTIQDVHGFIKATDFHHHANKVTTCYLTLENGMVVVGNAYCQDKASFDKEVDEKYSREKAIDAAFDVVVAHALAMAPYIDPQG